MHYPPVDVVDNSSSSSQQPETAWTRGINSTPALQGGDNASRASCRRADKAGGELGDRDGSGRWKRSSLDRPWSPRGASSKSPMIDITNFDYKTYRHELIRATLRRQYDDLQPPGDVVLNSLHLNSADSVIGVRLNDRYNHSLFDFVEEYYRTSDEATSGKSAECPHPLDHFLTKGTKRPQTAERETETSRDDGAERESLDREGAGNSFASDLDSDFARSPNSMDKNGNPCARSTPDRGVCSIQDNVSAARNSLNLQFGAARRRTIPTRSSRRIEQVKPRKNDRSRLIESGVKAEPFSTTANRPASAGGVSTTPKIAALTRAATLPESRKVATPSRPRTTSASRRRTQEVANIIETSLASASSSEIASEIINEIVSIRDERSRNEGSRPSHESSVGPESRSHPSWLSKEHRISFNRKYIARDPASAGRSTTARGGDLSRKFAVSSEGRSRQEKTGISPATLAFASRKPASAESRKDFVEVDSAQKLRGSDLAGSAEQRDKERPKDADVRRSNERRKVSKIPVSPRGMVTRIAENSAPFPSPLSSQARTGACAMRASPVDAAASIASVQRKEQNLVAENARRQALKSPLARDRRASSARSNRGEKKSQPKGATNPSAWRKSRRSPSPRTESTAETLNAVEDTNDVAAFDEKLETVRESRADLRKNSETIRSDEIQAVSDARKSKRADGERDDTRRGNANDSGSQPSAARIIENLRTRTDGTNDLPRKPASHSARRDANLGTKSGLGAARLDARSNDVVESRTESSIQKDVADADADEELKLPRRDSKVGLAMNSALRSYIKRLKRGLADRDNTDGVALASLSLTDAISILSEQRAPLSADEIRELQDVLSRVERNPELLCKESRASVKDVA